MIHIAFSNLKTWLLGTHHGVSHRHLQAYLNELVFRFNRRFYPLTASNSALGLAAHTSAPTYKTLYSSELIHPTARLAINRIGKVPTVGLGQPTCEMRSKLALKRAPTAGLWVQRLSR